jgi:hypothetical protein
VGANGALRTARLSRTSPVLEGEPMSRGELADAVNAHLWQTTHVRYTLDAHTIALRTRRRPLALRRVPVGPARGSRRRH